MRAASLVAAIALATTACNDTIRVARVTYTFKSPLVALPLGLSNPADHREPFAQVFCSAIRADAEYSAADCRKFLWLDNGFTPNSDPLPALGQYQIIVVAGIFSACLPRDKISIFKQGIEQLKKEGATIDEVPVSATGGTEEHAKAIADFVQKHQDPQRPFIAIGYSQGAADLLQAYVSHQVVRDSVKAVVTVAGAVGGSRLPDALPSSLTDLLSGLSLNLAECQIKGLKGLDALRRKDRYDFLFDHRTQLPRAYSVAAVSIEGGTADGVGGTSQILRTPWKTLTAYSIDEDSQVIRDDAVVPGGAFLATARADHWAVTLPFREAHDPVYDKLVSENHYPRTPLLEALVRYVTKDLKDHP
jgi:hypothetical protein